MITHEPTLVLSQGFPFESRGATGILHRSGAFRNLLLGNVQSTKHPNPTDSEGIRIDRVVRLHCSSGDFAHWWGGAINENRAMNPMHHGRNTVWIVACTWFRANRALWPEPYISRIWNAHVKDALEERLHEMVCASEIWRIYMPPLGYAYSLNRKSVQRTRAIVFIQLIPCFRHLRPGRISP